MSLPFPLTTVSPADAERGRVTLKLPWRKRDQRRADGLSDGIPDQLTSLIKVPADISEKLRETLLEQANTWLSGSQAIPPAMLQLLERQPHRLAQIHRHPHRAEALHV